MNWEYLSTLAITTQEELYIELNKYGSKGWEAFHIEMHPKHPGYPHDEQIVRIQFKRQV